MKLNKWTVGLAAVGVVSLASIAQADEKSAGTLASVSSTVLSGYVDTSMQWNLGTGDSHAPAYKYSQGKADGFNLDAVDLTLEKPLDEADWAAGYKVDLFLGPDAQILNNYSVLATHGDFSIKQAYVNLRAPVGTGLDFKIGVFDSIIGYESTDAVNDPNFTRSWGHTFEPSELTGVLSTYRFNNIVAASAGIADTATPGINARATGGTGTPNESYKTFLASVALTAPDDWGFISGSSFYAGIVDGFAGGAATVGGGTTGAPAQNYYAGATLNTPVTGLRVGASFDYRRIEKSVVPVALPAAFGGGGAFFSSGSHAWATYASYQATEKLSLHGRLEYADTSDQAASIAQAGGVGLPSSVLSATGTVQYDLWKNVLSRVEIRWDHALDGTSSFGGTSTTPGFHGTDHFTSGTLANSFIIAANFIYKF